MDDYDSQVPKERMKLDFIWILNGKTDIFDYQTKFFLGRASRKVPDWPQEELNGNDRVARRKLLICVKKVVLFVQLKS